MGPLADVSDWEHICDSAPPAPRLAGLAATERPDGGEVAGGTGQRSTARRRGEATASRADGHGPHTASAARDQRRDSATADPRSDRNPRRAAPSPSPSPSGLVALLQGNGEWGHSRDSLLDSVHCVCGVVVVVVGCGRWESDGGQDRCPGLCLYRTFHRGQLSSCQQVAAERAGEGKRVRAGCPAGSWQLERDRETREPRADRAPRARVASGSGRGRGSGTGGARRQRASAGREAARAASCEAGAGGAAVRRPRAQQCQQGLRDAGEGKERKEGIEGDATSQTRSLESLRLRPPARCRAELS